MECQIKMLFKGNFSSSSFLLIIYEIEHLTNIEEFEAQSTSNILQQKLDRLQSDFHRQTFFLRNMVKFQL